jgi:hypothetical protein
MEINAHYIIVIRNHAKPEEAANKFKSTNTKPRGWRIIKTMITTTHPENQQLLEARLNEAIA